ncbi:MAG: S41 family peptidase [Lachnospiraceae bacterium]|nr:S41 family peptidase [Lachnospiraceae bacterium]
MSKKDKVFHWVVLIVSVFAILLNVVVIVLFKVRPDLNAFPITTPSNTNSGKEGEILSGEDQIFPTYTNHHVVSEETLNKMDRIAALVNAKFYYEPDEKNDFEEMLYSTMVDYLGEKYSVYYDETSYEKLKDSTSGSYCGIGVRLMQDQETGYPLILEVFYDSPASKAGIKVGDLVCKAGETDLTGMDLDTAVSYIRGEENTTVDLEIYRKDTDETLTLPTGRAKIEPDVVSFEMKEDQIGYIYVSTFNDASVGQFHHALEELNKQGMKSLVVDLRNNPGGVVDCSVDMLDEFLDAGIAVYTEDATGYKIEYSMKDGKTFDGKMVVLVNGYSASASEIFTGAVIDYDRAYIVGTQTFGKGIVQGVYPLSDGTGVKLTTAAYYTPKGTNIHGVGFTPDLVVEDDPDTEADEQLDAAIEYLKK